MSKSKSPPSPRLRRVNKRDRLLKLYNKMKADKSLPLMDGATNLVFGEGNYDADIIFIGEGPGRWEDEKGLPFVGRAGALLNQALAVINVPRKEVFITNVVHHRPPGNRDPVPEELAAYAKYLDPMIEIIDPILIVTLGRYSMGKFMPGVMISNVHGKEREVSWQGNDLMVLPMYHPAAALRNGEIKRRFMEDFKKIPQVLKAAKEEKNLSAQAGNAPPPPEDPLDQMSLL